MENFDDLPDVYKHCVHIDFKRSSGEMGVQISFGYGIEGFEELLSIIKSCGGEWNKELSKWLVTGPFSFYCVDLISSLKQFELVYTDYFKYFMRSELRKMERNIKFSRAKKPWSKVNIPVPDGRKLFEFQKASVDFFNDRGKSILLADDMGVGKTISAIAIANLNKYQKILIICPDSAKEKVWKESLDQWYVGDKDVFVAYSNKDLKLSNILIINYDLIKKHAEAIIKFKFEYLIADEAHMLKSTGAQRTKIFKKIASKIKHKVFLTGTPILNKPLELYSLINILSGKAFGTKMSYAYRYCDAKLVELDNPDPTAKKKIYLSADGYSNLNELNFKLRSTIMMRREKADVIREFPNVKRHVFNLDTDYAKEIEVKYREERKRYLDELSTLKKTRNTFFEYREFTRAIKTIHRYHFDKIALIRRDLGLNKIPDIDRFIRMLLSKGINKIVLFVHHREVVDDLHRRFAGSSVVVYGGMTSREKAKSVNRFEQDDNIKIFIGSIQASGVAYTLTISHTVVFGELDWTPSMVDQCECRCIRLGQKNDVCIYYLIVNNSLDLNMLQKIHRKDKIIKTVMV